MNAREKLEEFAEMTGMNKNQLIGWSVAADFAEWYAEQKKLIEYPHQELGLPKFYAIKTNNGEEENWREAITKFEEIHSVKWGGKGFVYYGFDNNNNRESGTDCWDNIKRFANEVTVLTPTEFLNIVNNRKHDM